MDCSIQEKGIGRGGGGLYYLEMYGLDLLNFHGISRGKAQLLRKASCTVPRDGSGVLSRHLHRCPWAGTSQRVVTCVSTKCFAPHRKILPTSVMSSHDLRLHNELELDRENIRSVMKLKDKCLSETMYSVDRFRRIDSLNMTAIRRVQYKHHLRRTSDPQTCTRNGTAGYRC
jgi:hypothetical protein